MSELDTAPQYGPTLEAAAALGAPNIPDLDPNALFPFVSGDTAGNLQANTDAMLFTDITGYDYLDVIPSDGGPLFPPSVVPPVVGPAPETAPLPSSQATEIPKVPAYKAAVRELDQNLGQVSDLGEKSALYAGTLGKLNTALENETDAGVKARSVRTRSPTTRPTPFPGRTSGTTRIST
jgi:hypothetical protein